MTKKFGVLEWGYNTINTPNGGKGIMKYKLLREYIVHREMYEVSPDNADIMGSKVYDESHNLRNEYYQIVENVGNGECPEWEMVEDFYSYKEAVERLQGLEYEAYKEEFDPAEGEPVCFEEWLDNEWRWATEKTESRLESDSGSDSDEWCIKCGKSGKFEDGICEHCKRERE